MFEVKIYLLIDKISRFKKLFIKGNYRPKLYPTFGCYSQWFIFIKSLFYQMQHKYATNIKIAQISGFLLSFRKKSPFILPPDAAFNFWNKPCYCKYCLYKLYIIPDSTLISKQDLYHALLSRDYVNWRKEILFTYLPETDLN